MTQYQGDVFCLGLGGGDLPDDVQNKTQSIQIFGGVTVWMYTQEYSDGGGQSITMSTEDLSQVTYATGNATFSGDVMAMWIVAESSTGSD